MATSQNGWPVLSPDSSKLHTWEVPASNGSFRLRTRNGSAGFLLAHYALWYSEEIERVAGKVLDDWGYAYRPIRGKSSGFSNHASGTAIDLNATRHVLGKAGTLKFLVNGLTAYFRIKRRLRVRFRGTLRSGAFYSGRKDEMHVEINTDLAGAEKRAKALMDSSRGKAILQANPGQKAVILS